MEPEDPSEEFVPTTEEPVVVTCPFCGAASDGDLSSTMARLASCEHCTLDIAEEGEHTGFGDAIFFALSRRFGRAATIAAWKRLTDCLQ